VLGTIFLGIATPTEGGAMGAVGALIMAMARRRLGFKLMRQALDNTAKLSVFVLFILIGSTVFSFTFNAADGHIWVEHLFDKLPGGALGFLIVVNLLVFLLGMFIDFFEIAFIVIPILAPVAEKILPELLPGVPIDAVMVWFGVIIAMNLQTSFLTPPFGFALFYLRSVAAKKDYTDRVTGERIPAVLTSQIYKGSIAFICVQLVMVATIITFPNLVTDRIVAPGQAVSPEEVLERIDAGREALQNMSPMTEDAASEPEAGLEADPSASGPGEGEGEDENDPNKALLDAIKKDNK